MGFVVKMYGDSVAYRADPSRNTDVTVAGADLITTTLSGSGVGEEGLRVEASEPCGCRLRISRVSE